MKKSDIKKIVESLLNYDNIEKLLYIVRDCNGYDGSLDELEYWENDEYFFKTFYPENPDEVARAVCYGDYNYMDAYVRINAYGNLDSANEFQLVDIYTNWKDEIIDTIDRLENEENYSVIDKDMLKDI